MAGRHICCSECLGCESIDSAEKRPRREVKAAGEIVTERWIGDGFETHY
jgi:hypothetical protein